MIKSLAVRPKFVHLLTSLPSPTNKSFHQIETIFYSFIWGNKRDKIARKILINMIENGGLKMIDIRTFDKALKISWVKKIWDENYHADWKNLYVSASGYWKGVWLLYKKSVKHFATNLHNPFWKDVLKALAEFINDTSDADDYMKQPLWNNLNINIDKKITCRIGWIKKGVRFVNDLLDESGCLLTPDMIKNKVNSKCSYLEIYSITSAIPKSWKTSIRGSGRKLEKVSSKKLEEIFAKKKCTKITYSAILQTLASKLKKKHEAGGPWISPDTSLTLIGNLLTNYLFLYCAN